MTEEHTEAISILEQLSFSEPWSKKSLDEQVHNPRAIFLVAVDGDSVLGYGGMHFAMDEFYIDNIAVQRHHQRKGVGAAIMTALEDAARIRDAAFMSLEVRVSNRAVLLYKKLGFKEEGRRKNFYTDPLEDALILTKRFK